MEKLSVAAARPQLLPFLDDADGLRHCLPWCVNRRLTTSCWIPRSRRSCEASDSNQVAGPRGKHSSWCRIDFFMVVVKASALRMALKAAWKTRYRHWRTRYQPPKIINHQNGRQQYVSRRAKSQRCSAACRFRPFYK